MESSTLELETRLKKLGLQLQVASHRAATLQEDADTVVRELKSRGVSLTSPDAVHAIGNVQGRLDDVAAEIMQVRQQEQNVMEQLSGAFNDGQTRIGLGQLPPLAISAGSLDELRDAALRRSPLRIKPAGFADMMAAAVTPSSLPPASVPEYRPGVDPTLYEPSRVASWIPGVGTERPIVDYFRTTTGATAAASVAPGADKPESSPIAEQVTATIVKVAHWGSVQDEVLKDYSAWGDWMGTEFLSGLVHEENRQLISATGAGEDMVGLLATPGVLTYDRDATNETKLDALAKAITTLRLGAAYCPPTAIVLHPTDYLECQLLKASTAGTYLAGDPINGEPEQLWGYPVVLSSQCTQGYAIVANFPLAARVYWREFPVFEVAQPSTGLEQWKSNTTLVRAEERLVLAVHKPAAIVKVTLS